MLLLSPFRTHRKPNLWQFNTRAGKIEGQMATLAERDMILAYDSTFFALLVSSYRRTVRAEPAFFEPGQRPSAAWLYDETRHPVLAHNTDPDPRFLYANKAAQALLRIWLGRDRFASLSPLGRAGRPRGAAET